MELHAVKHWYDARAGMVVLEDDVLSIIRRVRELYGQQVSVELDPDLGCFHFVGHAHDGTDYLIFTAPELDARCLERLQQADSHSRVYQDPYDAAERAQDDARAEYDAQFGEKVKEVGEELAFALRREGKAPYFPLPVSIPRGLEDA